jgi:hypothetical protein
VKAVTLSGTGVRNDFPLGAPAALKQPTDGRGRVSSLKEEVMSVTDLSNGPFLLLACRRSRFLAGDQTLCQCERKVRYD